MTTLRCALEEYLALRRALGFKLVNMGYNLRHFVAFMEAEGATTITTALALRWAQQVRPACGVGRRQVPERMPGVRLGYVRIFARYRRATDPRTEIPPEGLLPAHWRRTTPYLYADKEIAALLAAARELRPERRLRPFTYETLVGLLAVSGMRISEVVALDRADVDLTQGLLTVRDTKFHKSRLIPLEPSTVRALRCYARRRDRVCPRPPASPRFFLSPRGKGLTVWAVRWTFVKLSHRIGLRQPGERTGPRLHDLRHRFAVLTLLSWYRAGQDVEQRLPLLSTYLGHAHVTDTYWYLTAVPELLALTKDRLERRQKEQQRQEAPQ